MDEAWPQQGVSLLPLHVSGGLPATQSACAPRRCKTQCLSSKPSARCTKILVHPSASTWTQPHGLIPCSGAASAQGLADYLLHNLTSDDQAVDVPVLLAPSPFMRASLHQAQPQVSSYSESIAAL